MMGFVLYEKLEILEAYNTALVYLTREELARFDIKTGDTEGFVNYGLSLEGIKLSVLIVDRTKLIKMSFRSKENFHVMNLHVTILKEEDTRMPPEVKAVIVWKLLLFVLQK